MLDSSTTSGSSANRKAQPETVALFISDLHLHPSLPRTTQAFMDFLARHAIKARQLYLLGDMFEYWAGDDDIAAPYNTQIVDAIRDVANAGTQIFWVGGNRDFLVGERFAQAAAVTLLPDPFIAPIAGQRIILTHGDAQCTDDHDYMVFRAQVRNPAWQQEFLSRPLEQRKAIIEGLRHGSREAQRAKSYEIMDVNAGAIDALFDEYGSTILIHGHTHRPAVHQHQLHGVTYTRHVLPDWDCDTESPRGGWIAIDADGTIRRFSLDELDK
ncbi:UDP-2,3-diacylglucosamine diphosphatase [Noviherbaspirillum massiliense]|uniref:UDP-2,3-diacylglucosamine diphosphatase n=1 Tax=Noviherbaspirillum massiliense TaxID=1465823 RepID=UPI0002F8712C|nr:UDP-2,3-diacylglucosamine diphosphatase [Noviherbaspirillum massiliense]